MDYSRLESTIYSDERMRGLRALVVGAGALGNEVIKTLGLLGISELTVVDPDVVDPSNLTRSILFRTGRFIGQNKAEAIADAARVLFPETGFRAIREQIADVGLQELSRVQLVFSCVDNDLARLEIAYLCMKLNVPCCDGGLGAGNYSHGRVTWFAGESGACFSCMLPAQRRRELLTTWNPITCPCTNSIGTRNASRISSTPTMAAIVASLQVDLALKSYIADLQQSQTVEIDLDGVVRLERFSLDQSAQCPFHWSGTEKEQIHPAPPLQTRIGEWLSTLDETSSRRASLYLDWPICTKAQCRTCQFCWTPMVRMALLRRLTCPACQSDDPLALECIQTVDQDSNWATRPFADLRLPHDHLLTTRLAVSTNED